MKRLVVLVRLVPPVVRPFRLVGGPSDSARCLPQGKRPDLSAWPESWPECIT